MNYRHIYHAGNFADILKHVILTRILTHLSNKTKAFRVLDTHAGVGLYDLSCEESQKTGEWKEGIGRLSGPDAEPLPDAILPLLSPYLETVKSLNPDGDIKQYPGSPKLISMLTRPQDRFTFIEKHPEDCQSLKALFKKEKRASIRLDDGWVSLRADLPPLERRGLVLVDPPFEEKDEYVRMIGHFQKGYRRWATGIYCLWYPIKARREVEQAAQLLEDSNIENILRIELQIHRFDTAKRLNGSGLFIVNPPYKLYAELKQLLPFLAKRLGQATQNYKLEWISEPK